MKRRKKKKMSQIPPISTLSPNEHETATVINNYNRIVINTPNVNINIGNRGSSITGGALLPQNDYLLLSNHIIEDIPTAAATNTINTITINAPTASLRAIGASGKIVEYSNGNDLRFTTNPNEQNRHLTHSAQPPAASPVNVVERVTTQHGHPKYTLISSQVAQPRIIPSATRGLGVSSITTYAQPTLAYTTHVHEEPTHPPQNAYR